MVKTRSETDLLHLKKGNTLVLRIWKNRHKHTDKTRITYALQWFLYVKLANEILSVVKKECMSQNLKPYDIINHEGFFL